MGKRGPAPARQGAAALSSLSGVPAALSSVAASGRMGAVGRRGEGVRVLGAPGSGVSLGQGASSQRGVTSSLGVSSPDLRCPQTSRHAPPPRGACERLEGPVPPLGSSIRCGGWASVRPGCPGAPGPRAPRPRFPDPVMNDEAGQAVLADGTHHRPEGRGCDHVGQGLAVAGVDHPDAQSAVEATTSPSLWCPVQSTPMIIGL